MLFETDPNLDIDRHIPMANATSPNSNHFCNNELEATQIDSPPIPKTTRPIIMTVKDLLNTPYATISCPRNVKHKNTRQQTSAPYLSTKMPPKNGKITLGIE